MRAGFAAACRRCSSTSTEPWPTSLHRDSSKVARVVATSPGTSPLTRVTPAAGLKDSVDDDLRLDHELHEDSFDLARHQVAERMDGSVPSLDRDEEAGRHDACSVVVHRASDSIPLQFARREVAQRLDVSDDAVLCERGGYCPVQAQRVERTREVLRPSRRSLCSLRSWLAAMIRAVASAPPWTADPNVALGRTAPPSIAIGWRRGVEASDDGARGVRIGSGWQRHEKVVVAGVRVEREEEASSTWWAGAGARRMARMLVVFATRTSGRTRVYEAHCSSGTSTPLVGCSAASSIAAATVARPTKAGRSRRGTRSSGTVRRSGLSA